VAVIESTVAVVDLYVTVQLLSFVAAVVAYGVSVQGLPLKTPLSPVPALANATVPCGGVCVPLDPTSVTMAVHVTFELIAAGIGLQLIVVVVGRLLTASANPVASALLAWTLSLAL
jgi:hypothetical protein